MFIDGVEIGLELGCSMRYSQQPPANRIETHQAAVEKSAIE